MNEIDAMYDGPSRSQLKREAEAQQVLGERLIKLKKSDLINLNLPENLFEAIITAQSIKSFSALKRQKQLVGKLMRSIEIETVEAQLSKIDSSSMESLRIDHWIESVVLRLIDNDLLIYDEIAEKIPNADHQRLRQLIRNMHKELKISEGKSKTRTLIFRFLRDAMKNISI